MGFAKQRDALSGDRQGPWNWQTEPAREAYYKSTVRMMYMAHLLMAMDFFILDPILYLYLDSGKVCRLPGATGRAGGRSFRSGPPQPAAGRGRGPVSAHVLGTARYLLRGRIDALLVFVDTCTRLGTPLGTPTVRAHTARRHIVTSPASLHFTAAPSACAVRNRL